MKTIGLALSLGLIYSLTALGGEGKIDPKSDLGKLQGNWVFEKDNKKISLMVVKSDFTFTMEGEDMKIKVQGNLKIDSKKKPAQMDLTVTEGLDDFKGKTALAIFAFNGNSLKWCSSKPGDETRPTAFSDKEGEGGHLYVVFKKAK